MTPSRKLKRIVAAIVTILVLMAAAVYSVIDGRTAVLNFFSVGQGDSALIRKGSHEVLIDAGPDRTVLAKLGRAMPFFDRTIELAVLTHPHADHFMGFLAVFERYRVQRIFVDGVENDTPEYHAFTDALRASGAVVQIIHRGDRIDAGAGIHFDVLWSGADDYSDDLNDDSIVLRLETPGGSALLMGDATAKVEQKLLAAGAPLRADIIKVGHHGSRFSSGSEFLRAVRAEEAIVSVGKNHYGHPSYAALTRLKAAGSRVRRTDLDGDIKVRFNAAP